jgi:predicted transcriptional regulator
MTRGARDGLNDLLAAVLAYAARGIAVFPLAAGEKIPLAGGHGVLDATTDVAQIRAWWTATPRANIGVAAGASGLLLVDVDAKDGRDGFTAWEVLRAEHPFSDTTPHVWTPNNGKHLYFSAPPGIHLRNTDDELGSGIETKSNGKYCVAPPSRLHDGRVYRWDERLNLDTVPIAPLPGVLCSLLSPRERADRPACRPAQPLAVTGDLATVQDALRYLDPWAGGYQWWVSILMALHSNYPGPDGLAVAEAWADGHDGEVEAKWRSFEAGGGVTIGTLYHEAEQRGWLPPWRTRGNGTAPTYDSLPQPPVSRDLTPTDEPAHLADDAPADRLHGPAPNLKPSAKPMTGWSAAELLAATFPEPTWAVPGFVPVGLTVLAGRPKVGKSWLALQIAIAKGTGGVALNQRVTPGRVLYLALEDNGRRLRDRAVKQGMPASATIRFETCWPRLTQGGLELLAQAIDAKRYAFVVLDTIGRALGRLERNDYGDNTELIGALQEIAISRDIAVLVLDHTRKPVAGLPSDPVDDIIGSTGKSGAVDAVLSLTKSQGKHGAVLSITGREVIQESYALSWDAVTCCWQLDGSAEEVALRGRKADVLAILRNSHPEIVRTSAIVTLSGVSQPNLSPILVGLVADGLVMEQKTGRAKAYSLTSEGLRQVGGPVRRGEGDDTEDDD